jgi:hypothetical protein
MMPFFAGGQSWRMMCPPFQTRRLVAAKFAKAELDEGKRGTSETVEMSKERGRLARLFHQLAGEPPALR